MIDEKKLIDEIQTWQGQLAPGIARFEGIICDTLETVIDIINDMDTVEWIPVSERQPEEDGYYIACGRFGNHPFEIMPYTDGWNCVRISGVIDRQFETDKVIAWLPLPPVYEEVWNK